NHPPAPFMFSNNALFIFYIIIIWIRRSPISIERARSEKSQVQPPLDAFFGQTHLACCVKRLSTTKRANENGWFPNP
ncbi:MAG: hypothetical protein ABFS56_20230, partial [Pseudomonadota bacterium]